MLPRATWFGARLVLLAAIALVISISPGLADTFFEGFEDGTLGAMEPMNLDAGLYSLEASDGYRCQYSDPDWVNSNNYVEPDPDPGQGKQPIQYVPDCYVGATEEQGNAFFWNVVDGYSGNEEGRSYTGHHSVWMGAIVESGGATGNKPNPDPVVRHLTAPAATLEGIVTTSPILIDEDSPAPELSFKHQISLPDYRVVNTPAQGRSADGGVVQAQIVSAGGAPQSDWRTLTALANGYDQQRSDMYTNCMFDPIDDGNTEDDFYDPEDPLRRLGPSSLCYDQWVFAYMGDTDAPFDATELGNAAGPGLPGETGLGTWVESRFDLSQYRGKRILIRFISSGIKAGTAPTYQDLFFWNPTPADDGWWIDDITVTGTVDSLDELTSDDGAASAPASRVRDLQARPAP